MKWRVIGKKFSALWHDENEHSLRLHMNEKPLVGVYAGLEPITINIICKNEKQYAIIHRWRGDYDQNLRNM